MFTEWTQFDNETKTKVYYNQSHNGKDYEEMKDKHTLWRKIKAFKMPKLPLVIRILLYMSTIAFAILAVVNAVFEIFPMIQGIVIYVLAALTLFMSCFYLTLDIIHGVNDVVKPGIEANPYAVRVRGDYRFRTFVFAVPGLMSNVIFAVFNGILGIMGHSAWFGSLSAYYIVLSLMRISAVRQERLLKDIDDTRLRMRKEISVYQTASYLFILMAVVLFGMVTLVDFSIGGKTYPGFVIYVAALYAFYKIIGSTIKVIRVRKQNSPLLTIMRRIGHIDACTSILTLQTALFASFATEGQEALIKIMNRITGTGVWLLVLFMGIQGIWIAKRMKMEVESGGNNID